MNLLRFEQLARGSVETSSVAVGLWAFKGGRVRGLGKDVKDIRDGKDARFGHAIRLVCHAIR
jgi:hypothetical protein